MPRRALLCLSLSLAAPAALAEDVRRPCRLD
jgi:hypothetical protein